MDNPSGNKPAITANCQPQLLILRKYTSISNVHWSLGVIDKDGEDVRRLREERLGDRVINL